MSSETDYFFYKYVHYFVSATLYLNTLQNVAAC